MKQNRHWGVQIVMEPQKVTQAKHGMTRVQDA